MANMDFYREALELINTPEPAAIGPERRPDALPIEQLDPAVKRMIAEHRLTPALGDLVRSAVYLWHDHLEESHTISQGIETQDGSLLHGIMHRREPDYANAKYWFRATGRHPAFQSLAVKAGDYLEEHEQTDLWSRLVPNNSWDPYAFVDACEDASEGVFQSKIPVLQHIQRLEFECFFQSLANRI